MREKQVNILWTGGWDSTFRLIQLQKSGGVQLIINPIYVSGDNRKSESKEIQVMRDLLPKIRKLNDNNIINDLKIINKSTIADNLIITEAYNRIREKVCIGSQYEYLSRLAINYSSIEVGIEKPDGDFSSGNAAINMFGAYKAYHDTFIIDKEVSSNDLIMLFGNFEFPIIETTEKQMVELIRLWNCEDIMKGIWFCHDPINNQPCGFCRPCQQKMECGMDWLLDEKGSKRYIIYKKLTRVFGDRVGTKLSNTMRKLK